VQFGTYIGLETMRGLIWVHSKIDGAYMLSLELSSLMFALWLNWEGLNLVFISTLEDLLLSPSNNPLIS